MGDISVSVDELRRAASMMGDLAPDDAEMSSLTVAEQPDLSLALAEFIGCMNACETERQRAIRAVATGLREVADMFESMDAGAQVDLRALGAVEGWTLP